MNDAVEALIRRLERSLSLTYDAAGSGARPCRAGELFRVRLGNRHFALKLYDPGHGSQTYEFRSVVINDKLEAIREFFAPPPVPFGWRLQVEDYSSAPQQPARPPATAGRPIGVR